jgi:transposase
VVRDIRRATRKPHAAAEKIRIVLEGLRGEESIAALCRRAGIAESLCYSCSTEFLEAGKRRLAGDTARAATTDEGKALREEARGLKEVVAEQALELRPLKKSGRTQARVRHRPRLLSANGPSDIAAELAKWLAANGWEHVPGAPAILKLRARSSAGIRR